MRVGPVVFSARASMATKFVSRHIDPLLLGRGTYVPSFSGEPCRMMCKSLSKTVTLFISRISISLIVNRQSGFVYSAHHARDIKASYLRENLRSPISKNSVCSCGTVEFELKRRVPHHNSSMVPNYIKSEGITTATTINGYLSAGQEKVDISPLSLRH